MNEILLTFIIPVYNSENYFRQCLDSLVTQTVKAHKAIIINDGSTDNSKAIAEEYVQAYPEMFELINQKNSGQAVARNLALTKVNTKFVTFLDSDDYQEPKFIEKFTYLLSKMDEYPDMVFTLPWLYDNSTKQITDWHDIDLFEHIFYPEDSKGNKSDLSIVTNVSNNKWIYALEPSPSRKIYRTEFLRNIDFKFSEGKKWEDVQPHYRAVHYASRCVGLKNTGFIYRINTDSQTTSGTGKTRLDVIDVFRDTINMAKTEKWEDEDIAYIIRALWQFTTWTIDVISEDYIDEFLAKMHVLFNEIPKKYFKLYFDTCSPHRRTEKAKTFIIKSPFYRMLDDYRVRNYFKNLGYKVGK